jgi:alpha-L-glutamate ligase-like protein
MKMLSKRWRFWAWPWELKQAGVLGINARNLNYITPLNPRQLYVRVDDKARTKLICHEHAIAVPQTFGIISRYGDIARFRELIGNRQQFVIKPACGAGGRGVLVIVKASSNSFEQANGNSLYLADIEHHLASILSGLFSLSGHPDKAIIEARVLPHAAFSQIAVGGTADIRIVICKHEPIAAMIRLPTHESRGRANLHQGAIGVGIDISTGRTTTAVHHNHQVQVHPDTLEPVSGLNIPHWQDVLQTAMKLSRALELGYVGVDVVLDAKEGPMVLEANARPGLNIQIANNQGLVTPSKHRLPAEESIVFV